MVGKARAFSPEGKRLRQNVMPLSPNHLLSRLLHTTPEAVGYLERVELLPGFWQPSDTADDEGHVYFPESGLLGLLGSGMPLTMGMALLGCQDCWWSGGPTPVQMQVLRAGHAQRIRWSVLQAQPQRFTPWLLQTAAASQQLVQHMAQMAFCAQNHTLLQRLVSCLLVVLNQKPNGDGTMSVAELAHWLACPLSQLQAAVQSLQVLGAVQLTEHAGAAEQLHSLKPQVLARLACSCHLQCAQGLGGSGSASASKVWPGRAQVGDISARAKDSATLMPSTPADKMPPA